MTEICRTCLEVITDNSITFCLNPSDYKSKTITVGNKLIDCVPEIDLDVVPNAVICNNCFESLMVAHEFKTKCLETEGRIQSYIEQMGYFLTCINLQDIVQRTKFEQSRCAPNFTSANSTIKQTPHLDIKNLQCDTKDFFAVPKIAQLLTAENMYKCGQCNYTTPNKLDFKTHEENHMKLHKCNKCDYYAPKRQILIVHMRKHLGEKQKLRGMVKPYKCLMCEYASSHKSNLHYHMRIHYKQTKLYKCTWCDYTTTHSKSLAVHVKVHVCEKHNGGQLLQCYHCGFKTITKSDLEMHVRMHKSYTYTNNVNATVNHIDSNIHSNDSDLTVSEMVT